MLLQFKKAIHFQIKIKSMKWTQLVCILLFSLVAQSQTVYKTPSGKKYHLASCRMVNNVSQKLTLQQAINLGLTACKICEPPIASQSNLHSQKQAKGESSTVQCKGKTKAGTRCKHKTSIANGYCFQHNPD